MGMDWALCLQKEVNNKISVDATVFDFPSLLQEHIFLPECMGGTGCLGHSFCHSRHNTKLSMTLYPCRLSNAFNLTN